MKTTRQITTFDLNDRRVTSEVMPAEQLKRVKTLVAGVDAEGFNRSLTPRKVSDIRKTLQSRKDIVFPPILLARVGDDLYDIDGQHRRHAHIKAEASCMAFIIEDCDLDQAKKNFAMHNSTASRVPEPTLLIGQTNPVARTLQSIQNEFDCTPEEVLAVVAWISSSRRNYDDDAASLPKPVARLTRSVLEAWSASPGWADSRRFPAFRTTYGLRIAAEIGKGAERGLGHLARLEEWRGKRGWFYAYKKENGTSRQACARAAARAKELLLKELSASCP